MQHAPDPPDAGNEGIDRKALRVNLQRFRDISTARLARVRGMLSEPHCQFLDLLPLLVHINNPTLPGYVSQQTPCGIAGYVPEAAAVDLARRLSRSFNYVRQASTGGSIEAVYIMGSPGTIGHSEGSDLDIWICYPEALDKDALALLQQKAERLQRWAGELRLPAHIFLMNGAKFRRGQREPLTGENCGTSQHYLLIDEFYRTGILLAGRYPAWWLVPPECDQDHAGFCAQLTGKRYVRPDDLVDFGGIGQVPAGEFVGAGIWQLYKAIDSPHKSVLKLLLFEVYVSHFPAVSCLSADYKRAVYRGIINIDELDPYVMIYRKLERHLLERDALDRLEVVRRCLYYKAGKKLSRPARDRAKSWQRKLMERLTGEWGWDMEKLRKLDARPNWHIQEVGDERNELVRELTFSYRFLSEFARHHEAGASMDAQEFSVLGRKLYAAYERRAGKIEMLNPGRQVNVTEAELSLCAAGPRTAGSSAALWALHTGLVSPRDEPRGLPLKQTASVVEMLSWAVANGVIGSGSQVAAREGMDGLRNAEIEAMVHELEAHFTHLDAVREDAFAQPAAPRTLLVFINVAIDPLHSERSRGVARISSRVDSLGFSALRENLVRNIETVRCNTWGEIIVTRYQQEDGLVRFLRDYLQLMTAVPPAARPRCTVRCFCASRPEAIQLRMAELLTDLLHSHDSAPAQDNTRYVLAIENRLHLVQQRKGIASSHTAASPADLGLLLAAPQREWAALTIDRYALRQTPWPLIATHLQPGQPGVFCETRPEGPLLYVVDEHGACITFDCSGTRESSALNAIDQFLASVRYRQGVAGGDGGNGCPALPAPTYYRLLRDNRNGEYAIRPLADSSGFNTAHFLNVQAIAEPGEDDSVRFAVYCEGTAFSQSLLGGAFLTRIAAHILSLRRSRERYPVYITDLDLSALGAEVAGTLQTIHYLQHKARLEAGINSALAATP